MANALEATAAAFGFGAVSIFCASLLPFGRKIAAELWSLYRSEFMIVGCLLLPAAFGTWAFLLLLLAMEWRGNFELFDLFNQTRIGVTQLAGLIAGLALVATAVVDPRELALAFAISVLAVLIIGFVVERGRAAQRIWLPVSSLLFPALLIALTGLLRSRANGFIWIFLAYATVEMNDAFALVIGKMVGRSHILPRLSPNKTLAGLVGGFLVGGATGFSIARYLLGISTFSSALIVTTILVSGLLGDLASSALKRWQNRKDFRPIAIAHGGALDIYDSFLFAAPAALLLRTAIGL